MCVINFINPNIQHIHKESNQSLMENLLKILILMLTLKSIEYMPNTSDELAVISSTHNNHSMELENDFDSVGLAVDVE